MGKVDGNLEMDLIVQFETIVDGAREIAFQLGLPNDFAQVFQSITVKSQHQYPQLTLAQAYESFPQARKLVESRFHEEIRIFSYEFPLTDVG